MVDYYITAVRHNTTKTRIDLLRIHPNHSNNLGPSQDVYRNAVVSAIEQKTTFATVYWQNNNYSLGSNVRVFNYNGEKFLRTDENKTPKDNLDLLPEF